MKANKINLGLGLAALGRPEYINIRENIVIDKSEETFKKNTFDILDFAYKNGIRYFDVAPSYGKGEQFLLDWHKKNNFEDIYFGTKWGYTYIANWQLNFDGKHEIKQHTLKKLEEQWRVSQELLPNLKFYQVHSATLDSGVLENQEVHQKLAELSKKYNIKIGMSVSGEYQSEIIEKALNISVKDNKLFDVFQITYNILEQSTNDILFELKKQKKIIIIKEALANGRIFKIEDELLKKFAKKYNVGQDAIALRYIADKVSPDIILSGAFSRKQLQENLKTENFKLTNDELRSLNQLQINSKNYWKDRSDLKWN